MIVEGLVDTGYANALKNLHQNGRISDAALQQSIQKLPDHLRAFLDN
jgi:hypothetical protein